MGFHGHLLELRGRPFRTLSVNILLARNSYLPVDLCLLRGLHGFA